MKRNKHHGLNVEFDGLCMDFGHVSLNKKKEFLCGDCYKIEENDKDHVLVLSDGLGSGVKANILSTLTATMLSTMIINQVELDEAVRAVAKTLPVCSVRNLAYATFTVLNFQGKQVSLYQFDNPDAILIRDGKLFDYPVETSMIEEKEIHKSCFELKDEDMLIIMSDGVTNAGMGKTTNGGWGRDDVMAFCRAKYHKGMSAQEMAGYLAEASLDLNLNETDDDITAIVNRMLVSERNKGYAVFVKNPNDEALRNALMTVNLDVRFSDAEHPFNYIHKVISGSNLYYIGNIDDIVIENKIILRGKLTECTLLDPRTGKIEPAAVSYDNGNSVITLNLAPGQSVFLVENTIFGEVSQIYNTMPFAFNVRRLR